MLAPSGAQQNDAERSALRWAEIALYAAAAGMREQAREALREFDTAFAENEGTSPRSSRAAIVARLAAALLGEPIGDFAITPPPRIASLARAVDAVIRRRAGDASGEELLDAFDDLDRHELHGLAKLLAALPGLIA